LSSRIVEDCRENGNAKGILGTYLGNFEVSNCSFDNPKILLDNGDIIWGIECWWEKYDKSKSLEKSEKEVDDFKEKIIRRLK
jgi:hypothetical protein